MDNGDEIKEKMKECFQEQTFADKSELINESLIFNEGFLNSEEFVTLRAFLESEPSLITID
jgi:hypothetical protein